MLFKKSAALLFRSPFVAAARVMIFAGVLATAHAHAAPSTISNITLYPGGATVERQIRLPAGGARIEVTCLPTSFDPQNLRLSAPPNVQLGEFHIEDAVAGNGPSTERCATTDNDKRVRALQTQLDELNARAQAIELSVQYLEKTSEQGAGGESSMSAMSHALEQSGFTVYAQREQIRQQQKETQERLRALRSGSGNGPVATRTLRIAFDAPQGGLLTIAYDTRRAGWIPAYQADFDSSRDQVTLERRALVAQATGEDWSGVKMQLSTGTPTGSAIAPEPGAWRLRLVEVQRNRYFGPRGTEDIAAEAAYMKVVSDRTDTPLFEPTQIEGTFLTQFDIPGKIDVPSDAQKVGFTLARQSLPARLVARVIPNQSTRAWLVATTDRPEGVWPDGDVQLRRDNAQVGETRLSQALSGNELSLPFGPDEQVTVSSTDKANASNTVKASGDDVAKTFIRHYTVKNGHRTPIAVEIVESTPVSDSADIKVTSNFMPQPDNTAWQDHQGIVAWKRTLAAGGEISVNASYTIRYPGKRTILGLP